MTELYPIMRPWPFSQWGLYIVGPPVKAKGSKSFHMVALNYFTKWVEAKNLIHIIVHDVQKLPSIDIICRFIVPQTILSSNSMQFEASLVGEFYQSIRTQCDFSAPYH